MSLNTLKIVRKQPKTILQLSNFTTAYLNVSDVGITNSLPLTSGHFRGDVVDGALLERQRTIDRREEKLMAGWLSNPKVPNVRLVLVGAGGAYRIGLRKALGALELPMGRVRMSLAENPALRWSVERIDQSDGHYSYWVQTGSSMVMPHVTSTEALDWLYRALHQAAGLPIPACDARRRWVVSD